MRERKKSRTATRHPRKEYPPIHPGEMLLDVFLKPLKIPQTIFAEQLGVSYPRLNEIIHKKRGVTPDTALRLAKVLGTSAKFWLELQVEWDLWNARQSVEYARIARLRPVMP